MANMMNPDKSGNNGPCDAVRNTAVSVLSIYDQKRRSIPSILRDYREESGLSQTNYAQVYFLTASIVKHLNTIDYVLHRSFKEINPRNLSPRIRNLLRILTYQAHWIKVSSKNLIKTIPDELSGFLPSIRKMFSLNLERIYEKLPKMTRLSLQYSHPTFIVETLLSNMSEAEAISLMRANNGASTSYFRVNNLVSTPPNVLEELGILGVEMKEDADVHGLYRIESGLHTLVQSAAFKEGAVLIQDKASVLAVKALSPQPSEFVWDACAAPGMKTHLIWESMKGTGRLVATDLSPKRISLARERAGSIGLDEVEWIHEDACLCPIQDADKILIDAPCTSTGILRSHPSYKWKLNKKTLFSIMAIQNKLLEGIISGYRENPGTEIVYSVCSILPHEGESQIDTILDTYNVELIDFPGPGTTGYPGFTCSAGVRRLFPSTHDTDGFFIAKLRITR